MRLEFRHYPAKLLCRALGVLRSGFYDWLHAKPSTRMQEDARIISLPYYRLKTIYSRCLLNSLARRYHCPFALRSELPRKADQQFS